MKQYMKKRRSVGKIYLLIFMVSILIYSQKVSAASISQNCAKAYADKLNRLEQKNSTDIRGYKFAMLCDVNGDRIYELFYSPKRSGSTKQPWTVYTYKKGKVKKIGNCQGDLYKIKGKKKQYKYLEWYGVGCSGVGTVTFEKNKIKHKEELRFAGHPMKYYKKGKEVNRKTYNKAYKKFTKSMVPKNRISATDVNGIVWTADMVKKLVK